MAETIYWLATLLWSLVVLLALIIFRRPLGRLIRSAGNRDLMVRVADQDLSVAEISRQHADLVNDLQNQVSALRQRVADLEASGTRPGAGQGSYGHDHRVDSYRDDSYRDDPYRERADAELAALIEPDPAPGPPSRPEPIAEAERDEPARPPVSAPRQFPLPAAPPPWERLDAIAEPASVPAQPVAVQHPDAPAADQPSAPAEDRAGQPSVVPAGHRPAPTGVLWVDDHPEHSAVQLDLLQRNRVVVHTARSTEEALASLRRRRYEMVVSGMMREENGKSIPNAGLELVRAVRMLDQETPIAIYSNGNSAGMYGSMARDAGANLLTGSWFELAEELRTRQLFPAPKATAAQRDRR
jgi:CheY-like chemotaxis protein